MENADSAYTFIELRGINENINKAYMSINRGGLTADRLRYRKQVQLHRN